MRCSQPTNENDLPPQQAALEKIGTVGLSEANGWR